MDLEGLDVPFVVVVIGPSDQDASLAVALLCVQLCNPASRFVLPLMAVVAKQGEVVRVEGDVFVVYVLRPKEDLVMHFGSGFLLAKLAQASVDGFPSVDVILPGPTPGLAFIKSLRKFASHGTLRFIELPNQNCTGAVDAEPLLPAGAYISERRGTYCSRKKDRASAWSSCYYSIRFLLPRTARIFRPPVLGGTKGTNGTLFPYKPL